VLALSAYSIQIDQVRIKANIMMKTRADCESASNRRAAPFWKEVAAVIVYKVVALCHLILHRITDLHSTHGSAFCMMETTVACIRAPGSPVHAVHAVLLYGRR